LDAKPGELDLTGRIQRAAESGGLPKGQRQTGHWRATATGPVCQFDGNAGSGQSIWRGLNDQSLMARAHQLDQILPVIPYRPHACILSLGGEQPDGFTNPPAPRSASL
jgi:hypothetical protein